MKSIPFTPAGRIALHLRCIVARPSRAAFYLRGIAREIPFPMKLEFSLCAVAATIQILAHRAA